MKDDYKALYVGEIIAPFIAALPSLTEMEFKTVYAAMLKAAHIAAERGALCAEYTEIVKMAYARVSGRSRAEAAKNENEDHTGSV